MKTLEGERERAKETRWNGTWLGNSDRLHQVRPLSRLVSETQKKA